MNIIQRIAVSNYSAAFFNQKHEKSIVSQNVFLRDISTKIFVLSIIFKDHKIFDRSYQGLLTNINKKILSPSHLFLQYKWNIRYLSNSQFKPVLVPLEKLFKTTKNKIIHTSFRRLKHDLSFIRNKFLQNSSRLLICEIISSYYV
jgi:hypothetical protein